METNTKGRVFRAAQQRRVSPRLITSILMVVGLQFVGSTASAQIEFFDERGNLVEMPFEPDVPVVRTTIRQEGETLAFVTFSSLDYDACVEHFRERYRSQDELAPGWTIAGLGFEPHSNAMVFTLRYRNQVYRLEVKSSEDGMGSTITVRSNSHALGFEPHLHILAPYHGEGIQDLAGPQR